MSGGVIAIVGSLRFRYPDWEDIAGELIVQRFKTHHPAKVISGGAPGVDTLAEQMAKEHGLEFEAFLPERRRWEPRGFKARNLLIAGECTRLLRITCAESRTYGSGWTADQVAAMRKPVERYRIHADGKVEE